MVKPRTSQAMRWVLTLAGIGVALAVTALAWRYVIDKRAQLSELTHELERLPEALSHQGSLNAEIEKRAFDVERIRSFVVGKEQLAQVVSEIENVGRSMAVAARIPTLEEKQILDENGSVVPPSGPLLDVRLKIVAVGNPKQLLKFLYAIEHMQLLTYFESWRLDASETTARNQAAALQPGATVAAPASERALLTADMVIAVSREKEEPAQ
ncbi:MAG: hypothetical protein AAB538_03900 [Patescibacteria group bacterium]